MRSIGNSIPLGQPPVAPERRPATERRNTSGPPTSRNASALCWLNVVPSQSRSSPYAEGRSFLVPGSGLRMPHPSENGLRRTSWRRPKTGTKGFESQPERNGSNSNESAYRSVCRTLARRNDRPRTALEGLPRWRGCPTLEATVGISGDVSREEGACGRDEAHF